MKWAKIRDGETEARSCPCHRAGHGPGAPSLPLCGAAPTATRQPYLAQVPGSRGWAEGRAGAGRGLPQPGRTGRRARGAGRGGERAGRRGGADWAPPAGEQTGFLRRPGPRPSPLPSAGPLPLPSPGVGRCAWHIPDILPPVSWPARPFPAPPCGAAGEIKAGAPCTDPGASSRRLCRGGKLPGKFLQARGPGLGGLRHVKGPGCLVAPLPAPDAIWPPLGANDFHRCCGLILSRTTGPRSILQMEIPDRGGRGRSGGLAAEIMQEVPEAGRPHRGSSHPGRPSWGDLGFPRHGSERPVSKQGHLTGWAWTHTRIPRASAFDHCHLFVLFEHMCHSIKLTDYSLCARPWVGSWDGGNIKKKSLTLPTCGAGPRDSREGQELAC